jgi:hypothetical protein
MPRPGFAGAHEDFYLVRTERFEPASGLAPGTPGHPDVEGIVDVRWWTRAELRAAGDDVLFGPRALPALLAATLADERAGLLGDEPRRIGL